MNPLPGSLAHDSVPAVFLGADPGSRVTGRPSMNPETAFVVHVQATAGEPRGDEHN
jgi:hypothetical protein